MVAWFNGQDKVRNIEAHPDTRLLQNIHLNPQHSIQILELENTFYLLEKKDGEKLPVYPIDDKNLLAEIRRGQFSVQNLSKYLQSRQKQEAKPAYRSIDITIDDKPTSTPLVSKLENAMAEFAQNNPETAKAFPPRTPFFPERPLPEATPGKFNLQAYFEQHGLGALEKKAQKTDLPDLPALPEKSMPAPLYQFTSPLVEQALQSAIEKQQVHLEAAKNLKYQIEDQVKQLKDLALKKEKLQSRFEILSERLHQFQNDLDNDQLTEPILLEKTDQEFREIQEKLTQLLIEGSAAQAFLETYPVSARELVPFQELGPMIQRIIQHRHMLNHLLQERDFKVLDAKRLSHLLERKSEIETQLKALREAVSNIDMINKEILLLDPLAVPEPVPVLAIHELQRLEFELSIIEADPRLSEREYPKNERP